MSKLFTNINSISMSVDNSSLISNIEWLKAKKGSKGKLIITFKQNDSKYEYRDVSPTVIEEMLLADSMGKFFHSNIKDQYDTYKEIA